MLISFGPLLLGSAIAAGPAPVGNPAPMTIEEYIGDLRADHRSDRLFAARELRRRVRRSTKDTRHRPGSLKQAEARQTLALFDQLVAPPCIELMEVHPELTVPCADIFRHLLTDDALPALEIQMGTETRDWARRRIEKAIQAIQESQ